MFSSVGSLAFVIRNFHPRESGFVSQDVTAAVFLSSTQLPVKKQLLSGQSSNDMPKMKMSFILVFL